MRLTYFNARGLAETSRILLAIAGVEYEDFRYPISVVDWSLLQFSRDEFMNDRNAGKLWRSLDKLPTLQLDDGAVLFQSKAIERYIASRFGMMGGTTFESAFIDAICETIRDFKDVYQNVRKSGLDDAKNIYFGQTLPNQMAALERILAERNTGHYAIGASVSLADVVIYTFLTDFFDNNEVVKYSYETCGTIKRIVDEVGNIIAVRQWLATRPRTPF